MTDEEVGTWGLLGECFLATQEGVRRMMII